MSFYFKQLYGASCLPQGLRLLGHKRRHPSVIPTCNY